MRGSVGVLPCADCRPVCGLARDEQGRKKDLY